MRTRFFAYAILCAAALSACSPHPKVSWEPVTEQRLLHAGADDGWLMYLRTYSSQAHVPYREINRNNVQNLREIFTHSVSLPEGFEAPPIVNGRTMIVTTPMDHVYALDAVNGTLLWQYDYNVPKIAIRSVCCDVVNRGVALFGNNLYLATLDNHVLALDARTGMVVWNERLQAPGIGYAITQAPLIVHGEVIVGDGGGEYGGRGFLEALDAGTGAERWRFYTVPAPNQLGGKTWPGKTYEHGGADPWMTGSYDPQTNTLFWGTGNPSPWLWSERIGQNLYSDSVLALDPDTGRLKWYFQMTPNDSWDYDSTATSVLADLTIAGRRRKVLYEANRNGWLYVIDRTNGKLISDVSYTKVTSVTGYDRARRIGITNDAMRPRVGHSIFTCPAFFGGDNWWSFSFDPQTGYAYIPTMHTCMELAGLKPVPFQAGAGYLDEGFSVQPMPRSYGWGALQAYDLATGKRMWTKETKMPWNDGTLSTDGGLVFSGTPDQKFYAFDARTGAVLWVHHMASGVIGQPVSYRVDGKQYIAVQSGWGGVSPFWGGKKMTPMFHSIHLGGTLYVFALQ